MTEIIIVKALFVTKLISALNKIVREFYNRLLLLFTVSIVYFNHEV